MGYQKYLKIGVKNIKNKIYTSWRPIYEGINAPLFEAIDICPQNVLDLCQNNTDHP